MDLLIKTLAEELGQKQSYIENVVTLLDEGNTIPFIARYRKEMHGSMDDTTLRNLETRLNYLRNLQERKGEVLKFIENQGKDCLCTGCWKVYHEPQKARETFRSYHRCTAAYRDLYRQGNSAEQLTQLS